MKTLFHFIFLVSLSGCSFLKPSVQHEDPEETAYSEEQSEETGDEDEDEDSQEFFEGSEEDDEDDFQEEEETAEDETEPEEEKKGFFARIFGWGDDDTEDSDEEDFQDEEEDDDTDYSEDDDSFDEESDLRDSEDDDYIAESTDDSLAPIDESSTEGGTVSPEETSAEQPAQPSAESQSDLPPAAITPSPTEAEEPAPKQFIPLKKIKAQAYTKGNYLVNGVYIARGKDTIESVSQKIYNEDHQEVLYAINPHLRNRALKVGDKVYYSSPRRPQDSSGILTYYEDMGIPPQTHLIAAEQNIRSVSQSLLGHKDSWKEIWATNPGILSKGTVTKSMELKYWPADAAPQEEVPAPEEAEMKEESSAFDDEDMKPAEEPPSPDTNIPDPVKITENRKKGFDMGQLFLMGALAIAIIFSFMIIIKKRRKKAGI